MHPLLQKINLEHPGLEAVRDAAANYDVSRALDALVDYFKTRDEPDTALLSTADENAPEAANRALRREFEFYNISAQLPGPEIDWTYRPDVDWEWTWALNRHLWWPTLASAYLATHDEAYARELDQLIRSWVGDHPPDVQDRSAWRALEAGLRMGRAWPRILSALKVSPTISRPAWLSYLRSIHDHAEFLLVYAESGSNRLLMEMDGVLTCGLVFPEFKRAEAWRETAIDVFAREMEAQVHPDGVQNEYSTGYQLVCIRHFEDALDKTERRGEQAFSPQFRERLVAMWESVMYMLRPDGKLPMLNDADQHPIAPRLARAGEKHGRADFVYVAANGQAGGSPADASHRFPWARRAVMRSGWDADALYGLLETAPFGSGHQHEDALTFEIMAYGQPLIGAMGRYTYTASPMRQYLAGSRGHNVVLIDDQEQAQRALAGAQGFSSARPSQGERASTRAERRTPTEWLATAPSDEGWFSNETFDAASGRYRGPWSNGLEGATWERTLIFQKPDAQRARPGLWIIRDRFLGDGNHTLTFLLHFFPGHVRWDARAGEIVTEYGADKGNLLVQFVNPAGLTFDAARGQDDPPRGWYSEEYGKIEPAWEIAARRETAFPAEFVMVLAPFQGTDAPTVATEIADGAIIVSVNGAAWEIPAWSDGS